MILDVLFWIFFVLACVGGFWNAPAPYTRVPAAFILICIGILGLKVVSIGLLR